MKISYNWLKRYAAIEANPEQLSEILTDTGLEVEGITKVETVKGGLEGVVIGEVVSCVQHENADRLKVTKVSVGKEDYLQIVCGAPNVDVNQKVVVATVGCILYPNPDEPFKIKKSKIRGVESVGMICAEDELGIGTSHEGIIVLPDDAIVGTPAAEYFNLENDVVFEIGLTPNRNDAMGHIGVLRDIVAYYKIHKNQDIQPKFPTAEGFKVDNTSNTIDVSVGNVHDVPRYAGLTISNITVGPSPDWLKNALLSIGLSPKNNVVDVTNFVMHEFGAPLHAFDCAALNGRIVVKNATEGDVIVTLDDEQRKLTSEDVMISNGTDLLCIAGVLGGKDSSVKESTTSIFLESAFFHPVSIRKTAKRQGLNTDASFRFERGVDPSHVDVVLKRAAMLIQEVAGGDISMDPVDVYPEKVEQNKVVFNYDNCNKLIGKEIDKVIVNDILTALDISIEEEKEGQVVLSIPTYRGDVTREADVIEEVLRIYGFNAVPIPDKFNMNLVVDQHKMKENAKNKVADYLVNNGCFEMMNNSLTKSEYVEKNGGEVLTVDGNVEMLNPLSQELNVMRQSLIFQGLETVAYNQNRQHPNVKLFEFGKIYKKTEGGYFENNRLLILLSGKQEAEQWNVRPEENSFYTMKGLVNGMIDKLGFTNLLKEKALKKSILADGINISLLKKNLGSIGWVPRSLRKQFGIKNDVFIADLDWDALTSALNLNKVKFNELPKTFEVRRDFSLLLNKEVAFGEINEIARSTERKLLQDVKLFDVYEGERLPEGKKSYAVSFHFQDPLETLKDKQVDKIMDKIQQQLELKLKAELRS